MVEENKIVVEKKVDDNQIERLNMVANFHTLTTPILIGFFTLLLNNEKNCLEKLQSQLQSQMPLEFYSTGLFFVGLFFYFATFFFLYFTHSKDGKLNSTYLHLAFYLSIATSLIFVILLISLIT